MQAYLAAKYGAGGGGGESQDPSQRRKRKHREGHSSSKSRSGGGGMRLVVDDTDALPQTADDVGLDEAGPVLAAGFPPAAEADEHEAEPARPRGRFVPVGEDAEEPASAAAASGEGASPPRRARHDSPDASPPRRARHDSPDASPPRRARHDSPDPSPPRRARHDSPDPSPPRRARHDSPDASPPRKRADRDLSPPRRGASAADLSPPRRKEGSAPDLSPPRAAGAGGDLSPPRRGSSPALARGGVQHAAALREDLRRREEMQRRAVEALGADAGIGAETIHRDKSGRRLDPKEERMRKREAERQKEEAIAKHMQWGRGFKQTEDREAKLREEVMEMAKPLARHADDAELNQWQKQRILADDPMAEYMMKQQEKASGRPARPRYQGPPAPPNRFEIQPGYRWDGRDRSNGFEAKWLKANVAAKVQEDENYRWAVGAM